MSALDGTGVQFNDLPPRGRPRLPDYPASFVYFLRDPKARITQFGIEAVTQVNPNARITQFGLEVIFSVGPQGVQLSGNPPAGKPRLLDYTWLNPGAGSSVVSSIPLVIPYGQSSQLSDNLPPRAPARLRDYTWFNAGEYGPLQNQDVRNPGQSSQRADNLPPKAPARARDYTFIGTYTLSLIGQDDVPNGKQLSGNAPTGYPRAVSLTDPGANAIIYLTAPQPPNPRFGGGQSTDLTALPPRAPARMVDYSFTAADFHGLDGKDATIVGDQLTALPPLPVPRLREYTIINTGQFPPPGPVPSSAPYMRHTDLPPRGPVRLGGGYPPLERVAFALLASPPVTTEQFQAVLFI